MVAVVFDGSERMILISARTASLRTQIGRFGRQLTELRIRFFNVNVPGVHYVPQRLLYVAREPFCPSLAKIEGC